MLHALPPLSLKYHFVDTAGFCSVSLKPRREREKKINLKG
jgi:hypothetical protein